MIDPFITDCLLPELRRLSARKRAPVATLPLSVRLGVTDRTCRNYLVKLERARLVERVGRRGGWRPAAYPYVVCVGRDGSRWFQYILPFAHNESILCSN